MLPKFFPILFLTLAGTIAGTVLCYIMRKRFIEKEGLPFPIGTAATETLKAGDEGGKKSTVLFSSMAGAGIFTLFRDSIKIGGKNLIPQGFATEVKNFPIEFVCSPMAIGIGYIIGFIPCAWWLAGGLFSHFLLRRWALGLGSFASAGDASGFCLTVAIGLMVGSGLGILVNFVKQMFEKFAKDSKLVKIENIDTMNIEKKASSSKRKKSIIFLASAVLVFLLSVFAGLPIVPAVLLLAGLAFASAMSASITGQTGINPMEIFGILVLLAIRVFVKVEPMHAFFIAGITAVSCGFAGDMLNDYKMGFQLGTDPLAQTISQLIGAVIGSIVAVLALFAIIANYGGVGGDTGLTAVQAHTVTSMINGIGDPVVFLISFILGTVLYLKGIPAMIIGIGMLLPLGMSVAIFIGGLISLIITKWVKRKEMEISGQVISAGLLGGEGLVGTVVAIVQMFSF